LQALVVQRSTDPGFVSLFRFSEFSLIGPVLLNLELHAQPESMESRVQKALSEFPSTSVNSTIERTEHLAILKRWYFRSHRLGEIFFADDQGSWPLRRIVRGIGRVHRGEQEPRVPTFSATDTTPPPS